MSAMVAATSSTASTASTTTTSSSHHTDNNDTLKRKRDDSPRSNVKKVKLAVSDDQTEAASDGQFEALVIESNVHDALDQLLNKQDSELFNNLVHRLSLPQSSPNALSIPQTRALIRALMPEMSRLDTPQCHAIITEVLNMSKWFKHDQAFVNAYVRFLWVLVSSIPRWWSQVAKKIIGEFTASNAKHHHSVLEHIFHLIPTASNAIQPIFVANFPHKSDSGKNIVRYTENLLKCASYCPELQRGVWGLILEKVVQLDVELDESLDEDDDEEDEEIEDEEDSEEEMEVGKPRQTKVDQDSDPDSSDSSGDEDEEITEFELQDNAHSVVGLKRKLDTIMSHLMSHLDKTFSKQNIKSGEVTSTFYMLLDLFKQYVLPTHRTRSVQYLMFKICHAHETLMEIFLVSMIRTALDNKGGMDKRQKAMQYVSSFVARARGLSKPQIVHVVFLLRSWIQEYIAKREVEVDASGSMSKFRMFFSASQTLFYIFCFRHRELRAGDNEWECQIDKLFQHMIVTKFNPLKYCKKTVVAMFAQIAQKEDAAYCFTIMEQNRLPSTAATTTARTSGSTSPVATTTGNFVASFASSIWNKADDFVALEGYFPFDPLVLDATFKWVEDNYIEWEEVAEKTDSGSEDYSDDDEEEDDE